MKSRSHRGFSLLEMMIVVAIGFTLAAISFIAMKSSLAKGHLDNAYDTTLMVLRNTRELAISQSHEYVVTFNPAGYAAGTILIQYQPPAATPGGILPALQEVNTITIPSDITYGVQSGFPTNAPDGFGTGLVPIDFGQGLGGASLNYVTFFPDGSSRDTNGSSSLGNYNSGVIYLTRTADNSVFSSRAITVWGATGRIRGWRLYNPSGVNTWEQQ
jgi:prepilin-type N-terminal cleavage/methylation domain-containing protein